jgi:hypothetical protein
MGGGEGRKNRDKTPFSCPTCGQKSWGKPGLDIVCRPCLVHALEAAGFEVDVAIIDGVRMRAADLDNGMVAAAA